MRMVMAAANKVTVDIVSDTVCPWCFVGKRRLEAAMAKFKGQKEFEVRWHPFMLNADASKEGVDKAEYYRQRFGAARTNQMLPQMQATFKSVGEEYKFEGKTGNTLNSHRLIHWAGEQGADKQDAVVENLFKAYFSEGKFINDKEVLIEAAEKAGLQGAREFVENESQGRDEVLNEIRQRGFGISGVPHFTINGRYQLSGAQDPDTFARVFSSL